MIYLKLLITFIKIGAFTFGGGYAMLPMIQAEVERNGWIKEQELVNFIAVSESTPGPLGVNIATYIGTETAGIPGAICSTFGVVLPSFVIILIVAGCFEKFHNSFVVKGFMTGLKPAVVGLITASAVSVAGAVFAQAGMSLGVFKDTTFYIALVIFAISVFMAFKKVHPILIILVSAVLGIAVGYAFGL